MKIVSRMIFLGILVAFLGIGCGDDDGPTNPNGDNNNNDNQVQGNVDLYYWYSNEGGSNPVITPVDSTTNSLDVNVNAYQAQLAGNSEVAVVLSDIRIADADGGQYQFDVDDIRVTELRNGNWIEDSEFRVERDKIEDLDVVLVLDASNSLGDRFQTIKGQAIQFAESIYNSTDGAEVAIVPFSTNVYAPFPLSDSEELPGMTTWVNNLDQDQFTSLYDAMAQGIQILDPSTAASKSMVTFTDGNDNNSQPANNVETIRESLLNVSSNGVWISSFTVGLYDEGSSLDTTTLNKLALNGGTSEVTTNVSQINTVFDDFSETIAKAHTISYIRNAQNIPAATPIMLHFEIEAEK